ncbi:IS1 family transposase [Citrobacter portucalensis]|uniref:IS1 family transposase n=1 Tax=Citrobacter portucalensis TaxID=1639133 RepID=UPI001C70347A|nr:hypothetical protein [Citrobacter portucalensis]
MASISISCPSCSATEGVVRIKPVSLAGITKSERLYGTDRRPNTIKMRRKKQVT